MREGTEIQLNDSNSNMSLLQSAHIVFKRKIFTRTLGLGNMSFMIMIKRNVQYACKGVYIGIFGESNANAEDIANKVSQYIESAKHELSLHPTSQHCRQGKKERL